LSGKVRGLGTLRALNLDPLEPESFGKDDALVKGQSMFVVGAVYSFGFGKE